MLLLCSIGAILTMLKTIVRDIWTLHVTQILYSLSLRNDLLHPRALRLRWIGPICIPIWTLTIHIFLIVRLLLPAKPRIIISFLHLHLHWHLVLILLLHHLLTASSHLQIHLLLVHLKMLALAIVLIHHQTLIAESVVLVD